MPSSAIQRLLSSPGLGPSELAEAAGWVRDRLRMAEGSVRVLESIRRPEDRSQALLGDFSKWLIPLDEGLTLWHGTHQTLLPEGQLVFVPAGARYARRSEGPCAVWVVLIRKNSFATQILHMEGDEVSFVHGAQSFRCPVEQIYPVLESLEREYPPEVSPLILKSLALAYWEWMSWALLQPEENHRLHGGSPVVTRMLELIRTHYSSPRFGVAEIAAELRMHPSSLTRRVREGTGLTVMDHLKKQRVLASQALLRDPSLSMEEIAAASGFSSARYFARVFKELTGLQPSRFRRLGHLERDE